MNTSPSHSRPMTDSTKPNSGGSPPSRSSSVQQETPDRYQDLKKPFLEYYARLSFLLNVEVNPARAAMVLEELLKQWTWGQVLLALEWISRSTAAMQAVSTDSALTPRAFILALEDRTALGTCSSPGCHRVAHISVGMEAYCRLCDKDHKRRAQHRPERSARY